MSIAGDLRMDPKPDPAPVTIAVLPASDNAIIAIALGRFRFRFAQLESLNTKIRTTCLIASSNRERG